MYAWVKGLDIVLLKKENANNENVKWDSYNTGHDTQRQGQQENKFLYVWKIPPKSTYCVKFLTQQEMISF